jgi:hypothetical protein
LVFFRNVIGLFQSIFASLNAENLSVDLIITFVISLLNFALPITGIIYSIFGIIDCNKNVKINSNFA